MFLPSRQDGNGIARRTGVIVFFFFFCVLQASTKTSPKHEASAKRELLPGGGGGGGALPSNRLMGMCRWMASHFHDWIAYSGVAFLTDLLEWARIFSGFWVLNHIGRYAVQK